MHSSEICPTVSFNTAAPPSTVTLRRNCEDLASRLDNDPLFSVVLPSGVVEVN